MDAETKQLEDIKLRKKGQYIRVEMWDGITPSSMVTHAKSITAASKILLRYNKFYPNFRLSLISDPDLDYYNERVAKT